MSRSRRQQCSQGRGVCGDAGEARRSREEEHARLDGREPLDPAWLREYEAWQDDNYCDGTNCTHCDPYIYEWRARTGNRPLPATIADAVLARCGLRVRALRL